jgi:2-C-methyl-D-erythritol 4-phosphate cytidylyltransferase
VRIYLDFDGCLHRTGRDKTMFEHIDAFALILRDHPHVEVVITSSWREEFSLSQLRDFFPNDIATRVADVTPVLVGATRHDEIMQHLQDTRFDGDYIVIDDDQREFPQGWPPLLLCDPNCGLDSKKRDELCRLLIGT